MDSLEHSPLPSTSSKLRKLMHKINRVERITLGTSFTRSFDPRKKKLRGRRWDSVRTVARPSDEEPCQGEFISFRALTG